MASLTNVIGHIDNVRRSQGSDIGRPLEWPKRALLQTICECPTPFYMIRWHKTFLRWIHENSRSRSLEELCTRVADRLLRASKKMYILRLSTAGTCSLPAGLLSDRHVVFSSLGDIMDAFEQFFIVSTDKDLREPHNRRMVLKYVQKTYEFGVILAQIIDCHGYATEWLIYFWDYLESSGLRDFLFDKKDDYVRASNPTCSGIILHQNTVPETCHPVYKDPPVLCQNPGRYGPIVLRNLEHPEPDHGDNPDWISTTHSSSRACCLSDMDM